MNSRSIPFEKISNARDLGGLRTAQGHVIAPGHLLRSANLAGATEADRRLLQERYRLAKIIDLRTQAERDEKPDAVIEDSENLPIPIFDVATAGISHERENRQEQLLAVVPKMGQLYRKMVTDPACREQLGIAARCVMGHDFSEGGVLWHCTEGKDRCGLLSAVLLTALGVDRGTITQDYLLTNEVNGPKAEMYYQGMLSDGNTEAEAAVVRDIFLAREEYLNEAFSAIDELYQDDTAFLHEGLHIPQGLIQQFRDSVLL